MNVLSLFDGISCGRVALERAGIPVTNYFACEIDKYAIKVSKANWPNIKHLGDVTKLAITHDHLLNVTILVGDQGQTYKLDGKIDLLIGGSPCQGFSKMGNMLNFADPRSKLFFEYSSVLRQLKKQNHKLLFKLENVPVKKEWNDIICKSLDVESSTTINSRLISPQNRKRSYWTNIPGIKIPEPLDIKLSDYLINGKAILRWQNKKAGAVIDFDKAACLVASDRTGLSKIQFVIRSGFFNHKNDNVFIHGANCKTQNGRISSISSIRKGGIICNGIYDNGDDIDQITPEECEMIQGLPIGYTNKGVSKSQRYKMIGNGWEINTIIHFFKNLPH